MSCCLVCARLAFSRDISVQREMMTSRIEELRYSSMPRSGGNRIAKQVDAGQLTKEAAMAEFGRRANTMTYDNGAGYLFGSMMDGVTVLSPDASRSVRTVSMW